MIYSNNRFSSSFWIRLQFFLWKIWYVARIKRKMYGISLSISMCFTFFFARSGSAFDWNLIIFYCRLDADKRHILLELFLWKYFVDHKYVALNLCFRFRSQKYWICSRWWMEFGVSMLSIGRRLLSVLSTVSDVSTRSSHFRPLIRLQFRPFLSITDDSCWNSLRTYLGQRPNGRQSEIISLVVEWWMYFFVGHRSTPLHFSLCMTFHKR